MWLSWQGIVPGNQNEIAVVSQAEEINCRTTGCDALYYEGAGLVSNGKSGDNWVEVGADTTGIPADAEFKFTISYKNANAGDVEAHSRTLQYKLPDLLIEPHVELSVIQDANGNKIGTITADTSAKTIQMSFTDEFLKREEAEVKTIDGSFSFYAGADRDKVRKNPNQQLIIGDATIKLQFETESDARLGTLNLTKTAGQFITDEAGISYLEYTLTVSTGDTAMPGDKGYGSLHGKCGIYREVCRCDRYRERGGYEPGFFCGALRGRKSGWKW